MKLQLNESTLNAYINEAIRQELTENSMDELLGSRNRKKNIRMITGQGWGNQNRDTKNWWGAANSDISSTDAESEAPQTLVGIVTKMEKQLMELEKVVGIAPQAENLGASITQTRNNGGVKTKASLLAAINALGRISDRLSVVEKQTGMNTLMESTLNEDTLAPDGIAGAVNYILAATTRAERKKRLASYLTKYSGSKNEILAGVRAGGKSNAVASNGAKGAGRLGKVGTALGKAGEWAVTGVGGKTGVVGILTSPAAIALACFAIAQTAATIATKGRSRNIVRTFNCASILAKRMGNVAEAYKEKLEALEGSQTQQNPEVQQETGQVNELNVGRAKKSFGTIEQGMKQLSSMMKRIQAKINGQGQSELQMPKSLNTPQEIKQFQEWANANGYVDQNGQQLAADGKFGQRTSYVYDQVAQKLGQLQESRGQINEAGGIENALKTLERKVGTTGTGGAAYADISTLSGGQGQGSSRLQNAQNAKNIMRTYPPVLNQYLQILKSAGANVNNLLPLRDDQRPHRNYSVKELQAIDRRIQELIQVAQTFEPQSGQESVKLPPKPKVVKPVVKPTPVAQKEPAENTGATITRETTPLGISSDASLTGKAETDSGNELAGERPGLTLPQSAMHTMAQTAQSTMPLRDRQSLNNRTTRNTVDALNTMRGNGASRSQIRNDKRAVRDARRTINRGQPISEQQFKDMVKEILKETLNK